MYIYNIYILYVYIMYIYNIYIYIYIYILHTYAKLRAEMFSSKRVQPPSSLILPKLNGSVKL